jgi:signal transduction histidine kinase
MASFSLTARAVPALTGRVRAAPAAWAVIAAGCLAVAVYFFLPADVQSIFFVALGLAAVCAVLVGTVRNLPRGERLPWYLFSLGLAGQVAGDAVSAVYEVHLGREPPLPSIADVFYLGGYPLLALGLFLILWRLGSQTSRAAVTDTIVVFCGVALVQWVFFIDPYNHTRFGTEAARLVSMAYPAMDVLLLVTVALLLVGPGGRTFSYRLLLASVGLWVVADEIFALDVAGYVGGSWLDALWLLAYVGWAAAALDPSMARIARAERRSLPRLTTTRLLLLGAAVLTAPAILLIERFAHHRVHSYLLGFAGAVLAGLVLLRLGGLVRSVERAGRAERLARRESEQARRLLARQNEQLLELDTQKDEFVSSVSHELRTPLTSIAGYVELMLEDEDDEQKRNYLGVIDRNSERLLGLVSDLLFSARLQGGRLELERSEVDLLRLVRHAVESARPRAEAEGVELTLAAGSVPPVSGEEVRLAQVVDNLISNAIKFTPGGGRVAVQLSARDGLVRFEISDTGIGISAEARERLFERFFRSQSALERQIQGTGLGLYISKAIIEAHGGRIGVESEDGKGTTFVVELPAAS